MDRERHTHDTGEGCCNLNDGACCAHITASDIENCPVCGRCDDFLEGSGQCMLRRQHVETHRLERVSEWTPPLWFDSNDDDRELTQTRTVTTVHWASQTQTRRARATVEFIEEED